MIKYIAKERTSCVLVIIFLEKFTKKLDFLCLIASTGIFYYNAWPPETFIT